MSRAPSSPRGGRGAPEPFRWALVGAGAWGARVADAIGGLPGHALCAVHDVDVLRARSVAARHAAATATIAELADHGAEAAIVATPPATHAGVGLAVLGAGVPALVEKPLSESAARELLRCARGAGLRLGVGHQLLHHEAVERLTLALASGALGAVRRVEATRFAPSTRSALDAWWELSPHDVALVCHLLGGAPEAVRVGPLRPDASAILAVLEWPSGVRGELRASYVHPTRERRLALQTEAGLVEFMEDEREGALRLPAGVAGVAPALGAERPLQRQLLAFARAVREGGHLLGGEEDARLVARVLSVGAESLARGGARRVMRRDGDSASGPLADARSAQ